MDSKTYYLVETSFGIPVYVSSDEYFHLIDNLDRFQIKYYIRVDRMSSSNNTLIYVSTDEKG